MKAVTLRKKELKDLSAELAAKQKELADTELDLRTGKEKDFSRVKKLRKDVARIFTIINELKTVKLVDKSDKIDDSSKKVK